MAPFHNPKRNDMLIWAVSDVVCVLEEEVMTCTRAKLMIE